jgi:hypothetical protein
VSGLWRRKPVPSPLAPPSPPRITYILNVARKAWYMPFVEGLCFQQVSTAFVGRAQCMHSVCSAK